MTAAQQEASSVYTLECLLVPHNPVTLVVKKQKQTRSTDGDTVDDRETWLNCCFVQLHNKTACI